MARKLIGRILNDAGDNQCWAKMYYDSEWQEYIVRFYRHAEYIGADSDYHSDDKADAKQTGQYQVAKGY